MSKVKTLSLPKKGSTKNYFIAGDWHTDFLCLSTYSIFKQHIKLVAKNTGTKPSLIINGDFLECSHLMGKKNDLNNMAKHTSMLELLSEESAIEFEFSNNILDELEPLVSEIIFIEGNHDWRYRNFCNNYAPHAYKHNFDYISRLKLKERGIPVIFYNDWLDIGSLSITHGMFHSVTALKRHWEASGCRNVIYSHVHRSESKAFMKRNDTSKAWSLGAMCDLNPDYIKNTDNNWINGYGEFTIFCDGGFSFHNHDVINQRISLNGTILRP